MKKINEFYYQPSSINEDDEDIDLELEGGAEDNPEMDATDDTDELDGMDDMGDSGEVEIDVSTLVTKQDDILSRLDSIEQNIGGNKESEEMTKSLQMSITALKNELMGTIVGIKDEIAARMPTNIEKLSLRSLSSFPFNKNVAQYWYGDKKVVPATDEKPEDEMYELTKNDVSNYNDADIIKSF